MRPLKPLSMLVIVLAALLAGTLPAAADVRFQAPFTGYDQFEDIGLSHAHVPSVNTVTGIQNNTIDLSERAHSCRSDGILGLAPDAGSHSIWFKFNFPGGTVTLDTAGSNYNTVMSLYSPAGTFADLELLACSDDILLVGNTAKITMALPQGVYFVQISRWASTPTASVQTLQISLSATFSGTAPANDNFNAAKAIVLGKTYTTTNVQFASEEVTEPDVSCGQSTPKRSVWYVFDPGTTIAELNMTLEGSVLDSGTFIIPETVIEVFEGTALNNLVSIGCNADTNNGAAALTNVEAFMQPVYIRVSEDTLFGLLGPSSYRLKVTAGYYGIDDMDNQSFENPLGAEWKETNVTGEGRLCGLGTEFFGNCSYQFTGSVGENSKLKQTVFLPANLKPAKGAQIFAVFAIDAPSSATNFKVSLVVNYTDGKPPTKTVYRLNGSPGPDYNVNSIIAILIGLYVGPVKIQFNNKSVSGVIQLDDVGLAYRSGFARSTPDGLLPPPVAPSGLRGMN